MTANIIYEWSEVNSDNSDLIFSGVIFLGVKFFRAWNFSNVIYNKSSLLKQKVQYGYFRFILVWYLTILVWYFRTLVCFSYPWSNNIFELRIILKVLHTHACLIESSRHFEDYHSALGGRGYAFEGRGVGCWILRGGRDIF